MNSEAATIDSARTSPKRAQPEEPRTLFSPAGTPADPVRPQFHPSALERVLVRRLLRSAGVPGLAVVPGDGKQISVDGGPISHRVWIRTRPALWALLRNPEDAFLEGFSRGEIEVSGDLIALLNSLKRRFSLSPIPPNSVLSKLRTLWRRHRTGQSRKNVVRHYDVGNEFYRLWLDEQLLYTCAYFEHPGMSLEEAQVAKMDHVCRKLRLRAGETVIEAGCGWGALALHMARQYGVRVRAYNLSKEQLVHARERARRENLEMMVEFIEADWRDIRGTCDAFVSVGMLEHVGPENLHQLGKVIRATFGNNGRGLIHSIGQNTEEPLCPWIEQQIFPGAQPPTLQQMMDLFCPYNLSVLDVENLRPHYAQTLRQWLLRFDRSSQAIAETFGEGFVRMWRIYLASSASAFEIGSLQLYQVLFAPIGSSFFPLSRRDIYLAS